MTPSDSETSSSEHGLGQAAEKQDLSDLRLAVIGGGRMGETLIRALLRAEALSPERVRVTSRTGRRARALALELGVQAVENNRDAVRDADVVLLCVKPQGAAEVLVELEDELAPGQLLVSILAGVTSSYVEERLEAPVPVVRVMPNTPSLLGDGMSALAAGRYATADHLAQAQAIFDLVGRTVVLGEQYFDAVTGLSGSGPAFLYIVIEALAEGGVKCGLPRAVATELAAQTCLGASRMVLETGHHPAVLKDAVTTPAGCTMDGILELEEGGLRVTLIKAIVEATRRSRDLVDS
ncbi:MAG: pyrroline-5-carboxylate reductase [Acidobacteriota bacterium]